MKVAILPWGNVIEDYLDGIGISAEEFATEMQGGWLFGYADALKAAGSDACIIVVSRNTNITQRIINPNSGTVTIVLPSPDIYSLLNNVPKIKQIAAYTALPKNTLANALQEEECTHIIMQEYADPRFDSVTSVAKRLNLPVIPTFQGGQTEPRFIFTQRIRQSSIHAAKGLIIASSVEAERMRSLYGSDLPIRTICNPIDPTIWFTEDRKTCRETLNLPEDARIIICHSRIDIQRKGIDVLFAAWRIVTKQYPEKDLRLHLVGDGPDAKKLREEIKRAPVTGLRWMDSFTQDRAEMRRELSVADLHVQASRHEGFSVAPMEAMACGLPTILSRAPGAADLLENEEASGGLLVPVGDSRALANNIATLLLDDERRIAMGEVAKRHVLNIAATEVVGKQLVDFLRSI